jgi:hypothetical protein
VCVGRAALLVLTAAVLAAGTASAGVPAWRKADNRRSLEIGLRLADVGAGWSEASAKTSPFAVDVGTLAGAGAAACVAPAPVAKTETDLIVTAGSESSFLRGRESLVSIAMLFKTAGLAHAQLAAEASPARLKPCMASELRHDFAGSGAKIVALRISKLTVPTGAAESASFRIAAKVGLAAFSETVYLDVVNEQLGRGIVETGFASLSSPPPREIEVHTSAVSANRLARYA